MYVTFSPPCKIQRDIFRIDFFHWPQIYFVLFLGKFQNIVPCCRDVEQLVSIGIFSAEKMLLLLCHFIWRRGTWRQQTDTHLLHCIRARDPFPRHSPLSAAASILYGCRAPAETCAIKAECDMTTPEEGRNYAHISLNGSCLLLDTAPFSVPCPKTSEWTLSHPASFQYPCAAVILGMLVEKSKHLQRLISPHCSCFLPLIKDHELKF